VADVLNVARSPATGFAIACSASLGHSRSLRLRHELLAAMTVTVITATSRQKRQPHSATGNGKSAAATAAAACMLAVAFAVAFAVAQLGYRSATNDRSRLKRYWRCPSAVISAVASPLLCPALLHACAAPVAAAAAVLPLLSLLCFAKK